jgi:hypothetical protein
MYVGKGRVGCKNNRSAIGVGLRNWHVQRAKKRWRGRKHGREMYAGKGRVGCKNTRSALGVGLEMCEVRMGTNKRDMGHGDADKEKRRGVGILGPPLALA